MPSRGIVVILTLAAVAVVVAAVVLMAGQATPPAEQTPQTLQVLLIKPGNFFAEEAAEAAEAGGKVPPEAIDFTADALDLPLAQVAAHPSGAAFLDQLRKLPGVGAVLDDAIVFRVRDGERITPDGGDALSGDNLSVLVVPHEIAVLFDDEHSAFVQIRMRVSGFQ